MFKTSIKFACLLALAVAASQAASFPFSFWRGPAVPPDGPLAWYDLSNLGLANAASINTIVDRPDRTRTTFNAAVGGSGTIPTYTTYSHNGLSIGHFTGTARWYTGAPTYNNTDVTIACIANCSQYVTPYGGSVSVGGLYIGTDGSASNFMLAEINNVVRLATSSTGVTLNTWHLLVWTISVSGGTFTCNFYIDNVSAGSGSHAGSTTTNGMNLTDSAAGGAPSKADIGEIILWDHVLTAANRALLHTYSQTKWGTP